MRKVVTTSLLAVALGACWFFLRVEEPARTARATSSDVVADETLPGIVPASEPPPPAPAQGEDAKTPKDTWLVTGLVVRQGHVPYPDARLQLSCFAGYEAGGEPLAVVEFRSGPDGAFTGELPRPTGTVTLRLLGAMPRHAGEPVTVVVPAGEGPPQDLELLLTPFDLVASGTVTDQAHRPIAGAWVRAAGVVAPADAEGRFRIELSSASGSLCAGAPGFASVHRTLTGTAGGALEVDFVLQPGLQIRGRVTDERGQPIAGAEVSTLRSRRDAATSGPDGSFVLDCQRAGQGNDALLASKPGYVAARVDFEGREVLPSYDLVLRRGTKVAGRVTGARGAALPGASVAFDQGPGDRLETVARDDGRFEFTAVAPGEHTMVTVGRGYAPDLRLIAVLPGQAEVRVDVQLQPGHFLGGTVVDESGKGIAGMTIAALVEQPVAAGEAAARREHRDARVVSSRDGTFRLERLPAGFVDVQASGAGMVRMRWNDQPVDRDVRLVVRRAAGLAGRVIDAFSGEPIRDFRIRLLPAQPVPGERPIAGHALSWARDGHQFRDPGGLWSTGGEAFEPGTVSGVEAVAKGYAPCRNAHVVTAVDPDPELCVLRLQRGSTITGRVIELATGAALAGARVLCFDAGSPFRPDTSEVWQGGLMATTAMDGSFTLEQAPAGQAALLVEARGFPPHEDGPFTVVSGATADRLVKVPPPTSVAGRLLDPEGQPMAGGRLSLWERRSENHSTQIREVKGTADGRYLFTSLGPGDYFVRGYAVRDGLSYVFATPFHLDEAQSLQLDLQPPGNCAIRGHLVGNVPDGSFRLQAVQVSGQRAQVFYGEVIGDRFELRGLPPGRYLITWHARGEGRPTGGAGECQVEAGASAELEIRIRKPR